MQQYTEAREGARLGPVEIHLPSGCVHRMSPDRSKSRAKFFCHRASWLPRGWRGVPIQVQSPQTGQRADALPRRGLGADTAAHPDPRPSPMFRDDVHAPSINSSHARQRTSTPVDHDSRIMAPPSVLPTMAAAALSGAASTSESKPPQRPRGSRRLDRVRLQRRRTARATEGRSGASPGDTRGLRAARWRPFTAPGRRGRRALHSLLDHAGPRRVPEPGAPARPSGRGAPQPRRRCENAKGAVATSLPAGAGASRA
jgi:hypothetical protein